ncbi:MAG: leukotriene A4 hydrolase C-terminal domain-containing protein [Acidobacteriota bacterium]|nr:leukotriene A4 hydrolase C-terminal domain-containing protein [Acidobacteriota bacterium]
MPRPRIALALFTLILLTGARQRAVQHPAAWPSTGSPSDAYTHSEPSKVTTRHLALDLTADFETNQLRGRATLEIENRAATRTLILDTFELDIERVMLDGGTATTWQLGAATAIGQALSITIEPSTRFVTIEYETSASGNQLPRSFGPALTWSVPEQTFGGQEPYLYSFNAPIGARSWMPVQDTPTVRMTYDATLRVPSGLLALMSAANNPTAVNDSGVYSFHMPYRIPAYLIALAVGRLEFRAFDDRTGVYAEPELIDEAAWELQSLPEMMAAGERIAGPFPFARHDVLLMPPTFFAKGMEHPMLNFIKPTLVVEGHGPENPAPKDLIAHELAHSWAGDATTLASWNDVWLNEGMASYLAHRILEELRSTELTEMAWADDLDRYETHLDRSHPDTTILHREVEHPIAGFDLTGYVKGALFLRTLEEHTGRARFDLFLQRYFQRFRWRWVDDRVFLAMFRETAQPLTLDLDEWLYERGLPASVTAPASSAIRTRVQQRASAFNAGTPIAELNPGSWSETETRIFLQLASAKVRTRMAEVDAALELSTHDTPPLSWLESSIATRYEPGMPAVDRVLLRGAPYTWIAPLYRQLSFIDANYARDLFERGRESYHPMLEQEIANILGINLDNIRFLKNAA